MSLENQGKLLSEGPPVFYILRSLKILISFSILSLTACAHPISESIRAQIDSNLTLNQLLESPDPYLEKNVMFGGIIVQTRSFENRTEVEVIQKDLDLFGYPSREDKTEGRFIFIKYGFLEPEIYAKGRYVTGAGKVKGAQTGKIDNKDYKYPLIEVAELKLWEDYNFSPYYGSYQGPFNRPYYLYGYGLGVRSFGGYGRFYWY